MEINVGEVIQLKKPHPCGKPGADKWKVLRVGADFRLEYTGCAHQVMMKRSLVEKMIVK